MYTKYGINYETIQPPLMARWTEDNAGLRWHAFNQASLDGGTVATASTLFQLYAVSEANHCMHSNVFRLYGLQYDNHWQTTANERKRTHNQSVMSQPALTWYQSTIVLPTDHMIHSTMNLRGLLPR